MWASVMSHCTTHSKLNSVPHLDCYQMTIQYNPKMLLYRSDELNLTSQGSIRFEYEDMVVIININKFGGGAAQFSAGLSPRKMICPDPFMGRLSDPNMHH